jgi:hypothetical protein
MYYGSWHLEGISRGHASIRVRAWATGPTFSGGCLDMRNYLSYNMQTGVLRHVLLRSDVRRLKLVQDPN